MTTNLEQAVVYIKAGDLEKGKKLLIQVIQQNPRDENAWLWMSRCVTSVEQKRECFQRALNINPVNPHAVKGLQRLDNAKNIPSKQQKQGDRQNLWIIGIVVLLLLFCVGGGIIGAGYFYNRFTGVELDPLPNLNSIITGEPIDYLPTFPDGYEIDDYLDHTDITLDEGTKIYSVGYANKQVHYPGDLLSITYYINMYPSESRAIYEYQKYIKDLEANREGGMLINDFVLDGANDTMMYMVVDHGVVRGKFISRIKNVVIVTASATIYDPLPLTEEFLKGFAEDGDLLKTHILGINKLLKK